MASFGLTPKLHRSVDIIMGLLVGWYRVRIDGPRPAINPNTHYVYTQQEYLPRLENALQGPLNSNNLAAVHTIADMLRGVENPVICDFGGAYGEDCLRIKRYIPDAICTVVEIPEIINSVTDIALLKDITFTDTVPADCDLLFSGGCVMNAHDALFDAIARSRPQRLVITSVETTDAPTYWSMVVYKKTKRRNPYITFNRAEFIKHFEALGYTLHDHWYQGKNNSGAFLNGQDHPDACGYSFILNP